MRTLVLVGAGNMGGAMLRGWADRSPRVEFHVVDPYASASPSRPGVAFHATVADLPPDAAPDVVVFAVKPQAMAAVAAAYRRFSGSATFVSVAAGVPLGRIAEWTGSGRVVRAMPNIAAATGRSASVLCGAPGLDGGARSLADDLFNQLGRAFWVEGEDEVDAATALGGSGPAYVFHLTECLAEAGQRVGLGAELASALANDVVCGAADLLRGSGRSPTELRRQVTSPGGTTEAGLAVLGRDDALEGLVARAVEAAKVRAGRLAALS